jgi:hypothetical protein
MFLRATWSHRPAMEVETNLHVWVLCNGGNPSPQLDLSLVQSKHANVCHFMVQSVPVAKTKNKRVPERVQQTLVLINSMTRMLPGRQTTNSFKHFNNCRDHFNL